MGKTRGVIDNSIDFSNLELSEYLDYSGLTLYDSLIKGRMDGIKDAIYNEIDAYGVDRMLYNGEANKNVIGNCDVSGITFKVGIKRPGDEGEREIIEYLIPNAVENYGGVLSAEDKAKLDTLWFSYGADEDSDGVINKFLEMKDFFDGIAEGTKLRVLIGNMGVTTFTNTRHADRISLELGKGTDYELTTNLTEPTPSYTIYDYFKLIGGEVSGFYGFNGVLDSNGSIVCYSEVGDCENIERAKSLLPEGGDILDTFVSDQGVLEGYGFTYLFFTGDFLRSNLFNDTIINIASSGGTVVLFDNESNSYRIISETTPSVVRRNSVPSATTEMGILFKSVIQMHETDLGISLGTTDRAGIMTYADKKKLTDVYDTIYSIEDVDDVIDKFNEVKDFLSGITETTTLIKMLDAVSPIEYFDYSGRTNAGVQKTTLILNAKNEATGSNSIALGLGSVANNEAEVAIGRFNKSTSGNTATSTLFSVGIGTDNRTRNNAFEIKKNGNVFIGDYNLNTGLSLIGGSVNYIDGKLSGDTLSLTYENNDGDFYNIDVPLSGIVGPIVSGTAENSAVLKDSGNTNSVSVEAKNSTVVGLNNKVVTKSASSVGANPINSFVSGQDNISEGLNSHVEGENNRALWDVNSAMAQLGYSQTLIDKYALIPDADYGPNCAHAEGWRSIASGWISHAEGNKNVAAGRNSHAEGHETLASGSSSHSEGRSTMAKGSYSHAQGSNSVTNGTASFASGYYVQANNTTIEGEAALGKYNKSDNSTLFSVGIGTSDSNRNNAITVTKDGDVEFWDKSEGSSVSISSITQNIDNFGVVLTDIMNNYKSEFFISPTVVYSGTTLNAVSATVRYPAVSGITAISITCNGSSIATHETTDSSGRYIVSGRSGDYTPLSVGTIPYAFSGKIRGVIDVSSSATLNIVDRIYFGMTDVNHTVMIADMNYIASPRTRYTGQYTMTSAETGTFYLLIPKSIWGNTVPTSATTLNATMNGISGDVGYTSQTITDNNGMLYYVFCTGSMQGGQFVPTLFENKMLDIKIS